MATVAPLPPSTHFNWSISSSSHILPPRQLDSPTGLADVPPLRTENLRSPQTTPKANAPPLLKSDAINPSPPPPSTSNPPVHIDPDSMTAQPLPSLPPGLIQNGYLHINSSNQSRGRLWEDALKNPVRFVEAKSLVVDNKVPYQPINRRIPPGQGRGVLKNFASPQLPLDSDATHLGEPGSDSRQAVASSSKALSPTKSVATSWTRPQNIGPGFHNTGNTCFLNATLQALVHTPALAIGLMDKDEHCPSSCRLTHANKFCALCKMHELVNMCFKKGSRPAIEPSPINRSISKFAPSMRGGRQEDAHEFLRLLVEAMQDGALGGRAEKSKQKQKESTFVHRMFGGKLRSRVICEHCRTASDTFDNFLDLSLDISNASSVPAALKTYRKSDCLYGANQYQCGKCKSLRDAKKVMSVFLAPPILTLHLKRFNLRGRKLNKRVHFDEALDLRPAMGEGAPSTRYKLYAVVCHQGSSNKSGHYYAHIKASNGQWYLADDSMIQQVADTRSVLVNDHAYILFYARERGDALAAAIEKNRHATDAHSVKRKNWSSSDQVTPPELDSIFCGGASSHGSEDPSSTKKSKTDHISGSTADGAKFIGPTMPPPSRSACNLNLVALKDGDESQRALEQPQSIHLGDSDLNLFHIRRLSGGDEDNFRVTGSDIRTRKSGSLGGLSRRQKKHRRFVNAVSTTLGEPSSMKPPVSGPKPRVIRG